MQRSRVRSSRRPPTPMSPIVTHALVCGALLSAVLCGELLAVLRVNPEILLNDYPPDIKAKWGPMRERTKRQRPVVVVAMLATILAILAWSVASLPGRTEHG